MYWVELWKRITSSTAWGVRAGSAARAALWSGWRDSSSAALATSLVVVSWPAITNSTQNPSSSGSVRARPSTSSPSRSEIRPSPAPARRLAKSPSK